jgi:hypothetical protein
MRPGLIAALVLVPVLAAAPAVADVTIVEQHQPAGGGQPSSTTIHLKERRIRVESTASGVASVVIFDGTRETFFMIDERSKSYREMTKEDLEGMMSQVSGMMAQMREQLANMPPGQRQALEKMMAGHMAGAASPAQQTTVYKKARSGEKVGQWTCDLYEGRREGEKRWDVCTVSPDALGLTAADFAVLQDLASFFRSMAAQLGDMFAVGTQAADQQPDLFAGVPVLRVAYRDGKPGDRYVLSEVRRGALDAALFQVPAGYKKEAMPTMGAHR